MAFIGILRWRQEYNVLSSVTGARRDSIGGALWNGAGVSWESGVIVDAGYWMLDSSDSLDARLFENNY